jgi:hypothetical protein
MVWTLDAAVGFAVVVMAVNLPVEFAVIYLDPESRENSSVHGRQFFGEFQELVADVSAVPD